MIKLLIDEKFKIYSEIISQIFHDENNIFITYNTVEIYIAI
jgi:hypothetical protein